MRVMRKLSFLTLACFFAFGIGASSCEQKVENDLGIHETKDPVTGKPVVTVDPSGGPVGSVVKTAGDIASTVFPGPGTIASIAANGILTILIGIFAGVAKKRQGVIDTKTAALDDANTAINATSTGLQQIVNTLPPDHAATVSHILDLVHDAAGVAGHLQDLIQPKMDTAGTGGGAPPAPVPAPAKA